MPDLLSVGLDVGTTSTQMIVSRLTVENRASAFAVPEMEIAQRQILYKSPVHFTPLLDESRMDGPAIRKLVLEEYRRAGITREQVDTGAVIITGETSRKENAGAVLEALSDLAGDFVVATAGPDLESVLAAKGAGAADYSEKTGKTVLHMDIGGGTSNLALIRQGNITATGCVNVGGRLLKLDGEGKILYVSPVLKGIWKKHVGDIPTPSDVKALADTLAKVLEAAAGLGQSPWLEQLTTPGTAELPLNEPEEELVFSFSGGVADCIGRDFPWLEFGDMGPLLGKAIRQSALCRKAYILGSETIRATVIGAGCHSAMLSGSTVYVQNADLPVKNIPVIPIANNLSGDRIRQELEKQEGPAVLAMPGLESPGYREVAALADRLAEGLRGYPAMLCLEADMAKALGQALSARLGQAARILCIDRVRVGPGSYLDIGLPVGPALPVIVKTLILNQ